MNTELQMRIEAWLDGELDAAAAAELSALLDSDPQARAYVDQLRKLRVDLREEASLSVSAAAAWAEFRQREAALAPDRPSSLFGIPRLLGACAAILAIGMGRWLALRDAGAPGQHKASMEELANSVQLLETDIEGASPVVYIDEPSGWTVVWVMVPESSASPNPS